MGCGALVDKLNNDKRAKFAEELAEKGKDAKMIMRTKQKLEMYIVNQMQVKNGVHYLVWVEYFYLN